MRICTGLISLSEVSALSADKVNSIFDFQDFFNVTVLRAEREFVAHVSRGVGIMSTSNPEKMNPNPFRTPRYVLISTIQNCVIDFFRNVSFTGADTLIRS